MTVIHQDEFASDAPHPIDLLERTVEDNGWAFERAGRDELNLSVAGKWSDHHFSFSWRDDLQIAASVLHLRHADHRGCAPPECRRPADVCECPAVDRPFRSLAGGRHHRLPPCHDLSRRRSQRRRNARRCSIWRWKPASIITRPSSSCCGAARAPKTPSPPRCWSARGGREAAVRILLIGAGRMGGALLKGWLAPRHRSHHRGRAQAVARNCASWRRRKPSPWSPRRRM